MGLKDVLMNKMTKKIMDKIDVNKLSKDLDMSKIDKNKLMGILEGLLGKEGANKLLNDMQTKLKDGENKSMDELMKEVMSSVDTKAIEKLADEGKFTPDICQDVLKEVVGADKTAELTKVAQGIAEEQIAEDEANEKKKE